MMAEITQNTPTPASLSAQNTESRQERKITSQGSLPIYEFREGVRMSGKLAPTAWLDQDRSGDYKPESAKIRKPRARRVKRLQRDCSLESISERGPHYKNANDEQRSGNKPSKSDATSGKHGRSLNDESGHRLRKKGEGAHQHKDEASNSFNEISPDDPAARGCKSCLAYGLPCSLLQEGSRYPCDFCIADEEDCELIVEPLLKQPCLNCKKRRIPCSFKIKPDQGGPCNSCLESSTRCVAGPLSRRSTIGAPLDRGTAGPLSHRSMVGSPMDRKTAGLPRVVPRQQNQVPSRVRRTPRRLQFRSITPSFYRHRSHKTQAIECASFKDYDHVISYKDVPRFAPTGVIQSIVTRFAHPITFNYEPPTPLEHISCHWCNDLWYGLVGLEPVEVEVIDYRNGGGYTEIENGHTCAGELPSRMCTTCTLARLTIAACTSHEVEPIPGVNPDAFTAASFRHYLVRGMTEFARFDWCCICKTPASFHCLKPQEPDVLCSDPRDGCGLLLCDRCAYFLMGRYGGVLERLIDGLKLQHGESVLRADAEFLHPKGELLQRYSYAGGVS